jgi:hypothetical protein
MSQLRFSFLLFALATSLCQAQVIATVAGGGFNMGDGVPAIGAFIGTSQGIALDKAGNIYFLDTTSPKVHVVTTAGIMNTVAGNGSIGLGFSNIGDGGPATSAAINPSGLPFFQGVALDNAGNLYFADGLEHRVRKVNSSGIISTFAGNGSLASSGDGEFHRRGWITAYTEVIRAESPSGPLAHQGRCVTLSTAPF